MRTRIAPSPTGFLHLGTARTALYSWAFARHHGGEFILRIEDTDVARSTQDSVDQILEAMHWLGLDHDEGPIYQMQRLDRYREVIDRMLNEGSAYRCYCTPEEREAVREAQRARGEKTHYDGPWRPQPPRRRAAQALAPRRGAGWVWGWGPGAVAQRGESGHDSQGVVRVGRGRWADGERGGMLVVA